MNLSAEQRRTLQQEYARELAQSTALHHGRSALLRQLDIQMINDDGYTADRITQVQSRHMQSADGAGSPGRKSLFALVPTFT